MKAGALRTLLTGALALLPLVLTVGLIGWLLSFIGDFIGPGSWVGSGLAALGLVFVANSLAAYLLGAALLLVAVYVLGLLVQSRLMPSLLRALDRALRALPLVGRIYELSSRFAKLLDSDKAATDYRAMTPVWCFFGGSDGAATLALLPNPAPVKIDGRDYHAVLVPTAPVPIGGALLYVPALWVRPAGFGIEKFSSIYVSMGLSAPPDSHA
jgi:uncharacterized membrane protein